MMRSLSSAVSGLRAHQTKMDVIGTNIANVNTYGFKSSRTTFSDVYYQTLSSGSVPMASMGGTNPTQIGYGSMVATIDVLNSQSGPASTDRALDLYISGDGMLAVKDVDGNLLYTRLGVLGFDAEGNLVDANGNFVMGFPMNSDGTARIGADGTVDIEELSRIKVLPEMIDQLTNISIGPNGDIIGTMPGETTTTQNNKRPDWLVSATPIDESYVVGDIKVTMQYLSELRSGYTLPDWIESLDINPNSMLEGDYEIKYDDTKRQIQFIQSGEVMYTGAYRKGGEVDILNANGDKAAVLKTHAYNEPAPGGVSDAVSFDNHLTLTVNYTDKGGNNMTESIIYDGQATQLTIGDIKLEVDPNGVAEIESKYLDRTGTAALPSWIESVYLSDKTSIPAGTELVLRAGVTKTVTPSYSGNSHLQWLDKAGVEQVIKGLDIQGSYTIEAKHVTTPSDGYQFTIKDSKGNTYNSNVITGAGQDVEFTVGGSPISIGKMKPENFLTTTPAVNDFYTSAGLDKEAVTQLLGKLNPAYTGEFQIRYTGADQVDILEADGTTVLASSASGLSTSPGDNIVINGITIGTYDTAFQSALGAAGTAKTMGIYKAYALPDTTRLATLSEKNTLRLVDESKNSIIAETTYNGSSRVSLGDLSLQVDKDTLNAMFASRTDIDHAASRIELGKVDQDMEPDWLWDANVANAQPGIGEAFLIGNIAIAKIPNMVAMQQTGNSYFTTSPNSGEASFMKPGINNTGTLTSGYLEMSNVDISKEFTEMITTQRGFQANTRIITVSDEMLQELVNLKR